MMSEAALEDGVSRKVILADGSEWKGTANLTAEGEDLLVTLDTGPTMAEAFMAFNNVKNTERIETLLEIPVAFYEKREEYVGFTRFTAIDVRGEEIHIKLRKQY